MGAVVSSYMLSRGTEAPGPSCHAYAVGVVLECAGDTRPEPELPLRGDVVPMRSVRAYRGYPRYAR